MIAVVPYLTGRPRYAAGIVLHYGVSRTQAVSDKMQQLLALLASYLDLGTTTGMFFLVDTYYCVNCDIDVVKCIFL